MSVDSPFRLNAIWSFHGLFNVSMIIEVLIISNYEHFMYILHCTKQSSQMPLEAFDSRLFFAFPLFRLSLLDAATISECF